MAFCGTVLLSSKDLGMVSCVLSFCADRDQEGVPNALIIGMAQCGHLEAGDCPSLLQMSVLVVLRQISPHSLSSTGCDHAVTWRLKQQSAGISQVF